MLCSLPPFHLYSSLSFLSFVSILYLLIPPLFLFSPPIVVSALVSVVPFFFSFSYFPPFLSPHLFPLVFSSTFPSTFSGLLSPSLIPSSFIFPVLYLCHLSLCTRRYLDLCLDSFISFTYCSCCTCFHISLFLYSVSIVLAFASASRSTVTPYY